MTSIKMNVSSNFEHERLPPVARERQCRPELRVVAEAGEHSGTRDSGTRQLGKHESRYPVGREFAQRPEGEGDSRVEVSTADVTQGVDEGSDHSPKDETDAQMGDGSTRDRVDYYSTSTREYQHESAYSFCEQFRL